MDKWLPILLSLLCTPALSAGLYKWVDDDGKVHYTDQPPDAQAEELSLPPLNSYTPPELQSSQQDDVNDDMPSGSEDAPGGAQEAAAASYEKLVITSPKMNETIRNNEGTVEVTVNLTPEGLKRGHKYQLMLDGRVQKGAATTLVNVGLGTHTVKAQVVDAVGAVQLNSQAVIFHLHRTAKSTENTNDNQPEDNSDAYTPSSDDADHSAEDDESIVTDGSVFDPTNITDEDDDRDSVYDPDYDSSSSGNYNPNYSPPSNPNYSPSYTPNYNQK